MLQILPVLFGISLMYYIRQRKVKKEIDEIVRSTLPSNDSVESILSSVALASYKSKVMIGVIMLVFSLQTSAQAKTFKSLMKYDIYAITFNDKAVCEPNGFTYGFVDYGIYKSRGFYFGIQNDNAVFGNSIALLESTSHKVTTEKNIKINTYQLVDMNTRNSYYKCRFWKINKLVYLTLQKIGERDILTYVLSPKNK